MLFVSSVNSFVKYLFLYVNIKKTHTVIHFVLDKYFSILLLFFFFYFSYTKKIFFSSKK